MLEVRDLLRQVRAAERDHERVNAERRLQFVTIRDVVRLKQEQGRSLNGVEETWLRLQLQFIIDGQESLLGPYDGVDGAWRGEPCFVVGGSRGLKHAMDAGFRLEMLDGFHSIGINHVVEDYHRFEWFLFQDKRFLTTSCYDLMREYKGRIFAHVRARQKPSERVTVFYSQDDGPSEHIIQGLYSFVASGFTALNLALISGANPIYMLGLDTGGMTDDSTPTHYKDDYPGEVLNSAHWDKYLKTTPKRALRYAPWADRFVNVDPLGALTAFRKCAITEVPELAGKLKMGRGR